MMDAKSHWEHVYNTKRPDQVSWYRPHLDLSLDLITKVVSDRDARVVDVGGGEATQVDDLLAAGYRHVDVLDLSEKALQVAKDRLGELCDSVNWLRGDVTTYSFESNVYDVWHDRAVFHFLTDSMQREAYVHQVLRAAIEWHCQRRSVDGDRWKAVVRCRTRPPIAHYMVANCFSTALWSLHQAS